MTTGIDEAACARARDAIVAARRAEHGLLRAVAELDDRGVASASGYRSLRRLVEDLWHVNPARARRLVAQAAVLVPTVSLTGQASPPVLPATAAVHEQGAIDDEHLRVIASTMERLARVPGLDPETYADAEATLAQSATTLAPVGLEKVAQRLVNLCDPDGAAPPEEAEPLDELHMVRRRDGRLQGSFEFRSRAEAELLVEVFDRLSGPAGPDDDRSLAQRRAEVLADLAAQAASPTGIAAPGEHSDDVDDEPIDDQEPPPSPAGAPSRAPGCHTVPVLGRALLTVTMDLDRLTGRVGHGLLDSEHPVDPAVARRLACDAGVVPMVLGSRSEPLDVGRLSYTVPEGMRRALHARDRGCTFPGCARRPRRCHAHHVRHWLDGGPTELGNLALLCRHHHQLIHHEHWSVRMIDGRPWFRPPRWVDPDQEPRPGGPHPLLAS